MYVFVLGAALAVLVGGAAVVAVLLVRRQRSLEERLNVLAEELAVARITGLLEGRDVDADGEPRVVRRKGHLGLIGAVAAGLGIGAAWVRDHRTVSVVTASAIVAGAVAVALLINVIWGWNGPSRPEPAAPPGATAPTAWETSSPPSGTAAPTPRSPTPTRSGATPTLASDGPTSTPGPSMTVAMEPNMSPSGPLPPDPGETRTAEPSGPAPSPTGPSSSPSASLPGGALCAGLAVHPLLAVDICLGGGR